MNRKILLLAAMVLLVVSAGCGPVAASGEIVSADVVSEPEVRLELGAEPTETVTGAASEGELAPLAFMPAVAKVAPRVPEQISAAAQSITVGPTPTLSPTDRPTPTSTPTETPTPAPRPEKKIVIDLSDQWLGAYLDNTLVMSTTVSTGVTGVPGRKDTPTPVGTYRIYQKILKYKMEGGSKEKGTYYYLEDVPHIQYFWGSYGLHGTYWHENFGVPMSRGCVNLSLPDAEWLFNWTLPVLPPRANAVYATEDNPGTVVIVQE